MKHQLSKYILKEYGLGWALYKAAYWVQVQALRRIPGFEKLFEKTHRVRKINLFEVNVREIQQFLRTLREHKQETIINEADDAISGKLKGFSSVTLDYGNPINWHLQPITGKEIDATIKWYHIPDFDRVRGDIKVVWEASRLTHFYQFARAFLLTEDQKYYEAFSQQLESWLESNKYPYGANYKCGQECSLRMINALVVYSIFHALGLTTSKDDENIKELVKRCYKKVTANFFYAKHMRNNHTFSELAGLIVGAWCCEEHQSLRQAYKLLEKEIRRQFYTDGGYLQYSFNYQRFSLQVIEFLLKIEPKTKVGLSSRALELIQRSVLQLYQMQDHISGDVPNFGANDGALIFPVTACDYRNFSPLINTLYLSITGERLYNAGEHDEEVLWLSNRNVSAPIKNIERVSTSYNQTGFYTLRRNSGFVMMFCHTFDFRPFHMDGLHVDLWHKGRNIFCDSGTYSYASELGRELVKTKAHNTAKVQGVEQMESYGNFIIYKWTSSRDVKHTEDSFTGTLISRNGYEHARSVQRVSSGYVITDEVVGEGDYCEFYFHTPYDVKMLERGFEIFDGSSWACKVTISSGTTPSAIHVEKGYRSTYYLKKEVVNCVIVRLPLDYGSVTNRLEIVLNDSLGMCNEK